jgi:hypothetical protein
MSRLLIFSSHTKMNIFLAALELSDDFCMVYEKPLSKQYAIVGAPINAYSIINHQERRAELYNLADNTTAFLVYDNKKATYKRLLEFSEICIIGPWDLIDSYFIGLYSYLIGLSDQGNNSLPITFCDHEPLKFHKRIWLTDYLSHSFAIKKYRNKEYMNIRVMEHIKLFYDLNLNFDDLLIISVMDEKIKDITHCPEYYINNAMSHTGLFTFDEMHTLIETYYEKKYLKSYQESNKFFVKTTDDYENYVNMLVEKGINHKEFCGIFNSFEHQEHNCFKRSIEKFFEQKMIDSKKEIVCN